ncbi:unnamed protein product [Ambrosiozyma monospora]|uniref:Unnamed protein product n=1 Tax=Ambrosiozyma monospora TaxID=43982 RepID=A0A9W6Z5U6_AMBMO|nr:unnamed protein product [Ambrosiozyma monospora]
MSSSISEPFVAATLSRVPVKISSDKICQIANVNSSTDTTFDIAVSGSMIGTYIMRPSPRMIWSNSLSPQTIINSFDSMTFEDSDSKLDEKLFAISVTERNKHYLKKVE